MAKLFRPVACTIKGLEPQFMIVNCDPKPFIVQATGPNNFAINCKINTGMLS